MSLKEAIALDKIWYGATSDGSFDAAQSADVHGRQVARQEPAVVDLHQEHRHRRPDHERRHRQRRPGAAGRELRRRRQHDLGDPIANASTTVRNKWLELDYAGLADA